ncbi:MAG TPA: proton-conducting transporter membrane subunit, partial [Ilumatobacteraceae bacterium]|nr:proton-conducting transporter membrane subunit [Ilumatobacteraceae bacterium]
LGFNAAIFGMVAHGLITGMLFFVAGSIKERYHTLEIKRLGGLLLQMPKMGWILGFAAMASLGLPGLAGFWGEFPAIVSTYNPGGGLNHSVFRVYMVIAAMGTVLAAGYLLWLFQRVAFGEPKPEFSGEVHAHSVGAAANHGHDGHGHGDGDDHHSDIHDVSIYEWIAWTPFLIGIVLFGVYPQLLFRIIDPASQVALKAFGG